jgi:CHASE3 domain sensor protein
LEAARAELEQQQQELEQKMKELTKLTAFEEAYASHIKGTETTRTKIQVKRERERDDKNLRDGASKKLKKKKS